MRFWAVGAGCGLVGFLASALIWGESRGAELAWASIAFVSVWLGGLHYLTSRERDAAERERRRRRGDLC